MDIIKFNVVQYMEIKDIIHFAETSKDHYEILDDQIMWKQLIERDHFYPGDNHHQNYRVGYMIELWKQYLWNTDKKCIRLMKNIAGWRLKERKIDLFVLNSDYPHNEKFLFNYRWLCMLRSLTDYQMWLLQSLKSNIKIESNYVVSVDDPIVNYLE